MAASSTPTAPAPLSIRADCSRRSHLRDLQRQSRFARRFPGASARFRSPAQMSQQAQKWPWWILEPSRYGKPCGNWKSPPADELQHAEVIGRLNELSIKLDRLLAGKSGA